MHQSTTVLVSLPSEPPTWSRVGFAAIEHDPQSGMAMLCLRLCALAPVLYISLADLAVLLDYPEKDAPPGSAARSRPRMILGILHHLISTSSKRIAPCLAPVWPVHHAGQVQPGGMMPRHGAHDSQRTAPALRCGGAGFPMGPSDSGRPGRPAARSSRLVQSRSRRRYTRRRVAARSGSSSGKFARSEAERNRS